MLVLDLVLIGLAITLEPIPLTAFILVLASTGGTRKGAAFVFGWLVSLVVVVALTIAATGNAPPEPATAPSLALLAVKIAIGVVLLVIAERRRRHLRLPKKPKKTPKWQAGVDSMSSWFAMFLAFLVQPWGLIAAGIATIAEAHLSSWENSVAVVLFCVLATATYLVMEAYAIARPERANATLTSLRSWIDTHTDQVIIVVSAGIGLWLIGNSLYLIIT